MRTPGLFWLSFGPRSRVPKSTPGISHGGRELKIGASTAISNQGLPTFAARLEYLG